ncbi:MAG: diguanylate cyclase, partial [Magnetospirillum sp.]|nr:diguanylate cyclase [Magnetospirillum sp.]
MSDIQALLNGLLDSIHDAVIIADGEGNPLRSNPAFESLMGFVAASGTEVSRLAAGVIHRALLPGAGGRWRGMVTCPDGKERPFEVTAAAINSQADYPDRYLCVVRPAIGDTSADGTGSFGYDTLTGLPNRDLFADRIGQAVLQANRTGASVALLMLGLDRFTLVNDALGHAAGDRLLIEVARRLRMCVRETDTAVRLDGDKFAMVMAIADVDDSVIVAEKALNAIKEPFALDGQEVVVTFSIGISVFPLDADSSTQLVKHAENALHYAKVSGRNQYQFFAKDMNRKARSRLELESRIRRALANDEFVVYYQPKVSADRDTIVGAEALIRWMD